MYIKTKLDLINDMAKEMIKDLESKDLFVKVINSIGEQNG